MSYIDPKPSNLAESFDNIPAIDDDEQSEKNDVQLLISLFFYPKSIIFAVVVDSQFEDSTNNISNGMGSKSMDSINSYDGSRNALDDGQDQGDDVEKARLISQVLELQNTLDDLK